MPNPHGVAEAPLPGEVLLPNAPLTPVADPMEQFGQELPNPHPDAVTKSPFAPAQVTPASTPATDPEKQRFEYWQSEAQKAQQKTAELTAQLTEKAKYDPLINLVRSDDESFQFLQARLSGQRTPAKPLEAPQRPDSYNEVEAYSNPESPSFKYRIAELKYKDSILQSTIQRQNELEVRLQNEQALREEQKAQAEGMKRFHDDVVGKGIVDQDFADFFQIANSASVDDMVDYYKYRKQRDNNRQPSIPGNLGGGGPANNQQQDPNQMFGAEVLSLSRRM